MAEPIEIIIRQGGQDGEPLGGAAKNTPVAKKAEEQKKEQQSGWSKIFTYNRIKGATLEAINIGIQQYGNLTGQYIQQRRMQEAMNVLTKVGTGITLAATQQWALLAIYATTETISFGMRLWNQDITIKKENQQSVFMRERASSVSGSGSRGTYE